MKAAALQRGMIISLRAAIGQAVTGMTDSFGEGQLLERSRLAAVRSR